MANTEAIDENAGFDKKAAKRAEKMRKKEEKKIKKAAEAQNVEEEAEESGSRGAIFFVTLIIIIIWLGILALLIKLDVGGFGSTILRPVLKDVPYLNRILPESQNEEVPVVDVQYPYATLGEAVDRIKELEVELSQALAGAEGNVDTIAQLQAEIDRLKEFETEQSAFEELKSRFYEEVVFADQAPDIEEYKTFYESIDPANAAELYKQVVQQVAKDEKIQEYAQTYASMKPKAAAAIMEEMKDDLASVAEILNYMDVEARADILGAMDPTIAASLTKLMKPKEP